MNYSMDSEKNRARGNDQLSTRIGAEFLHTFNTYLSKNNIKKTQFIRDALEYWMSVGGHPEKYQQTALDFEKENQHLRELLAEKERTISILQDQIQWLNAARGHVQVNGNKNSHITAVAEREIKYHQREE